jgi:predicted acetyltransferase
MQTDTSEMQIITADLSLNSAFKRYMKICNHCGIDFYQDLYPTPENALDTIVKHAKGVDLHANFFPYCTHFCIQDGEILGAIRLRLGSNAFIKQEIGHIGYETKPSARGKG